jgi:Ca-activated chloride channel family protein
MSYRPLVSVCLMALAASSFEAQQPPTFEAEIEVINLTLTVTDTKQRFVTTLEMKDFAIYEDGIRQQLTYYTHDNVPISLSILVDCSGSMRNKLPQAQSAAISFVKTLRAEDAAQIVQFNERAETLQDFTSDQPLLEAAVKRAEASGPTALHNALYVALRELAKQKTAGTLRRRAIVLLSDGEDTSSFVDDEQVLELARKTEIAIYSISLRENTALDRDRRAFSQAEYLLTALSRETGGAVYFPTALSELDAVYGRIAEELRTQYSVGYVSSNLRRDGKWRRIVLRTLTGDDLLVRHKLGYYAPAR